MAVWLRIVIEIVLAGLGLVNIGSALRLRHAPTPCQERLLFGLCGLLLSTALWLFGSRQILLAALAGITGSGCGIAWLYLIYQQSLHNTTM